MTKLSAQLLVLGGLLMMCCLSVTHAQTSSGKIVGKITDVESGEAIIGANVTLLNTSSGASTNIEGEFTVLNVVPGTYSARVTYVGYQSQVIENVRIVSGITQVLNVKMKSSAVELGDVVVTAQRKFFEEKATNDVKVYDSKDVASLPVKGVERVLSIQAGVVSAEGDGGVAGNATVNVRGGRGGEVLYVVDGVAQNDLFTGTNYSQVSTNAIEQVSFQIGGYEAKYGQAQSGIVNVTTKTGSPVYNLFADGLTSTRIDEFGYNLYSGTLSGPIIPGIRNHTLFLSAERGWFKDANPTAIGLVIPSVGIDQKYLPENEAAVWRFTGRTYHDLDFLTLRLGANVNFQDGRTYTHRYAKNNAEHNPRFERKNYSFSSRVSKTLSKSTFFNVNVGYRRYTEETGDGVHFKNLERYGDPAYNPGITSPGTRVTFDDVGIFFAKGRVSNSYTHTMNDTYSGDIDISAQIENHLLEIGGGANLNNLRYYSILPTALALGAKSVVNGADSLPLAQRSYIAKPFYFGFDITGQKKTTANEVDPVTGANIAPRKPIIAYAYIQDRYELKDLVLNLGLRVDYFNTKAQVLKNEALPYDANGNPVLVTVDPEVIVSPRIGLGFPVTPTTVFHAQFGKFVQQPKLNDVYTDYYDFQNLKSDDNFGVNTGNLRSEQTTQYELGFRQILGDNAAALNITMFYKNTKDLVNTTTRFFQRQDGGQVLRYYGPANADFGTVRGVGLTLDVSRVKNLFISLNYTYSIAEGTGSSTNSSYTATFRNTGGEVPVVIAPLEFDQRHTGTVNVGFNTSKDELGILENMAANLLVSFNSGRPYTPLQSQNLLAGTTNYGDTKGYINSAYGPGEFSVSLKLEKSFYVGKLSLTPYFWVENLFNEINVVRVYQSTGDAYTTGYLSSAEGQANAASRTNWASDYTAFERDPANFGVPRQFRLGLKMNLGGFEP